MIKKKNYCILYKYWAIGKTNIWRRRSKLIWWSQQKKKCFSGRIDFLLIARSYCDYFTTVIYYNQIISFALYSSQSVISISFHRCRLMKIVILWDEKLHFPNKWSIKSVKYISFTMWRIFMVNTNIIKLIQFKWKIMYTYYQTHQIK